MKKIFSTALLLLIVAIAATAQSPKYVFYFIGDGMGPSHVWGAELLLKELDSKRRLSFTEFPTTAFVTTFSASNGVTDSAASGTALATGNKTNNGWLGMTPDGQPCYSVAKWAKDAGYAVGVSTTVPINHATPGAFYAHQNSRNNYNEIAEEMRTSGYDFFAGGDPIYDENRRAELYKTYEKSGYTIARGYRDFCNKSKDASRIMLYQKDIATQLPYAIDQNDNDLNLAQITEAGIEFLSKKSNKGFFFMIEGGKIDYASHSNDAATVMHEVEDFDAAIRVALEFYNNHPDETLIIVTADHETGGLVLGYRSNYTLSIKRLEAQKCSEEKLGNILDEMYGNKKLNSCNELMALLEQMMGIKADEKQREEISRLYSKVVDGDKEQSRKYMHRIANYASEIVSQESAISWASGNHSAAFVPLFAIGAGAERFNGVIDNTDIPKRINSIAEYK